MASGRVVARRAVTLFRGNRSLRVVEFSGSRGAYVQVYSSNSELAEAVYDAVSKVAEKVSVKRQRRSPVIVITVWPKEGRGELGDSIIRVVEEAFERVVGKPRLWVDRG